MTTQPIDLLWIVLCAALVFLMQAGCLCLESDLTRNKNSINVAAKKVADFAIAALGFWLVGFGLMFGPTWGGWLGAGLFGLLDQIPSRPGLLAFVLFQPRRASLDVAANSSQAAFSSCLTKYCVSVAVAPHWRASHARQRRCRLKAARACRTRPGRINTSGRSMTRPRVFGAVEGRRRAARAPP